MKKVLSILSLLSISFSTWAGDLSHSCHAIFSDAGVTKITKTAHARMQDTNTMLAPHEDLVPSYELNSKREESASQLPEASFFRTEELNKILRDDILFRGTNFFKAIRFIEKRELLASATNVKGWGSYFLPSLYGVQVYDSSHPQSMTLPVRVHKNAKILNWAQAKRDPFYSNLVHQNGDNIHAPKQTFRELALLGVDIVIVDNEWLILNCFVITPPKDLAEWISFFKNRSENKKLGLQERGVARKQYEKLLEIDPFAEEKGPFL